MPTNLDAPIQAAGISVPRSGHHYLVRLLKRALGDQFQYCEYYAPRDCCKAFPCTKFTGLENIVVFQKNHDLELIVPKDIAGLHYVVQYRDPVHEALSDREYIAATYSENLAANRDEYIVWLGRKAAYLAGFEEKWIKNAPSTSYSIFYNTLLEKPAQILEKLLEFLQFKPSRQDISIAVTEESDKAGNFGEKPFSRRDPATSRFAHWDCLDIFTALLFDKAPLLFEQRPLSLLWDSNHPLVWIYRAERARFQGRASEGIEALGELAKRAGENPFVCLFVGKTMNSFGRPEQAVSWLRRCVTAMPNHEEALRELSDTLIKTGDLNGAVTIVDQLRQLAPARDDYRLHAADLLLRRSEAQKAYDMLMEVVLNPIATPQHLTLAATIMGDNFMEAESVSAAARAVSIAPWSGEYRSALAESISKLTRRIDLPMSRAAEQPVLVDSELRREAVCIISTYNHLHQVLALVQSIRRTWSVYPTIYVALLDHFDRPRVGFIEELQNIVFVSLDDLHLPNSDWITAKYDAYELSCACKPFLVRYALRKGHDRVWYVDSDIIFFSDPSAMRDIAEEAELVVTPHLLRPISDEDKWRRPSLGDLAASGIVNAGLFLLRPSESVEHFLASWAEMVTQAGAFFRELGLNEEQHAFNWCLSFVDKVRVCRDPRINIAYWNLLERPIRWSFLDGGPRDLWLLQGQPIICFHFSGFRVDEDRLSHFDSRHNLYLNVNTDSICSFYRDCLRSAGLDYYRSFEYERSKIGAIILDRPLRQELKLLERRGRPDDETELTNDENFASFFLRQLGFQSALPALLEHIYLSRPDLLRLCDHNMIFPANFFIWMKEHMITEYSSFQLVERADFYACSISAVQEPLRALKSALPEMEAELESMLVHGRIDLLRHLATIQGTEQLAATIRQADFLLPAFNESVFLRSVFLADPALHGRYHLSRPDDFANIRDEVLAGLDRSYRYPPGLREQLAGLDLNSSLARVLTGVLMQPHLVDQLRSTGISASLLQRLAPLSGQEQGFHPSDLVLVDWWIRTEERPIVGTPASNEPRSLPHTLRSLFGRLKPKANDRDRGPEEQRSPAQMDFAGLTGKNRSHLLWKIVNNILVTDTKWDPFYAHVARWYPSKTGRSAPLRRKHRKRISNYVRHFPASGPRDESASEHDEPVSTIRSKNPLLANALARDAKSVNVFGYFRSPIGLGNLSRGLTSALRLAGFRTSEITLANMTMNSDLRVEDFYPDFAFNAPRNLIVTYPHIGHDLSTLFPPVFLQGRENIAYCAWEQRDLPYRWLPRLETYDRLLALSSFTADALSSALSRPVSWLPAVVEVDVEKAREFDRNYFGIPPESFVVGFVFDATSSVDRKNPLGTVQAICDALKGEERAFVVIKVTNGERARFSRVLETIRATLSNNGIRYKIVAKILPRNETLGLIACCNLYVSLHRSEGFGYTIAEAMYLKVPVVATAYSGNMDFTTHENSYLVNYSEAVVDREDGPFQLGTIWAEPDLKHAAALIRMSFEDYSNAEARAELAYSTISGLTSRDAVASRLVLVLDADLDDQEAEIGTKGLEMSAPGPFADQGQTDVVNRGASSLTRTGSRPRSDRRAQRP